MKVTEQQAEFFNALIKAGLVAVMVGLAQPLMPEHMASLGFIVLMTYFIVAFEFVSETEDGDDNDDSE